MENLEKIIDCKKIANEILEENKNKINNLKEKGEEITLSIIQIGDDKGSTIYRNSKKKKCEALGIKVLEFLFDEDEKEENILKCIDKLNSDKNITGIFLEMPLPKNFNQTKIINHIDFRKDVDCLTNYSIGALSNGDYVVAPATPFGIVKILESINIDLISKNVVIMGRSNTVGKPLFNLLLNKNANVSIIHSKTKNQKEITSKADILIASIGRALFVKNDFVKENSIVIDVGINQIGEGENKKVVGDVDFDDCLKKVSLITPVPGGVGVVTSNILISNLIKLKENYG